MMRCWSIRATNSLVVFFFSGSATSRIYTLSLHDALPISCERVRRLLSVASSQRRRREYHEEEPEIDRKSTRLNSSHRCISYAVFCLKKKKAILHHLLADRGNHDAQDLRHLPLQLVVVACE